MATRRGKSHPSRHGKPHPSRPGRGPAARRPRRGAPSGAANRRGRTARGTAAPRPARPKPAPRSVAPEAIERALARQPWASLRAPLERAGADAEPAIGRLRRYAGLLLQWNRSASNLISRNDEERIVERHLLESIAPAQWLRDSGCTRWIDFGSGGGLPALPLVIAGIGGAWTLVESRRTKTLFIRKAIQELSIENIEVVNDRLENFVVAEGQQARFDGFTSRATLKLSPTLALASHIVAPGGTAFLWKGSGGEQEMAQDSGWQRDWEPVGLLEIGSGQNVVARFKRRT
jgi:16S rRNA (guanine527-N7)-methyltransferase